MSEVSSGPKVRILVIEDNAADVELLRYALGSAELDCELTILVDGAEGLAYVRSESGGNSPPPDLVVLDLNLPKNDGAEVLQAMRAAPSFARIPVAVLSSSSSLRERARIEQFGVTRYITKPSDLDDFLKIGFTLRDILAQRHTSRSTGE